MGHLARLPDAEIETALAFVTAERDPLRLARILRERLGEARGRFAAGLLELRRRAAGKLEDAERLWLDAKGLEQASATPVARARARRVARVAPGSLLFDATAGLGGDAAAALRAGVPLVAGDRDPAAVLRLRHNLGLVRANPWVVRAAAEDGAVRAPLLALDPDRRAGGARAPRARARAHAGWSPDLAAVRRLVERHEGAVVKLPPAFAPADLPLRAGLPHRWEWVSLRGEAKELTLWTGRLAEEGRGERSALVLGTEGAEARLERAGNGTHAPRAPALSALAVLAEADPAVARAGLDAEAGAPLGLTPLAPGLGYLGRAEPAAEGEDLGCGVPFVRAWRVLGSEPLDRKRVRRLLARFDVGEPVVKTRGAGASAAELAARLRGPGARRGLVVVLGLAGERRVFLVEG